MPLLKVFLARRLHGLPKKEMVYLTVGKDGLFLVKLRRPKVETLDTAGAQITIRAGFLSNAIEIMSEAMRQPVELTFSNVYHTQIDRIAASLEPFGTLHKEAGTETADRGGVASPHPGLA